MAPPSPQSAPASSNRNPQIILELLRRYESRNVTFLAADGSWPVVWRRARGVRVTDEAGRKYLDLTAAFGVAAAGHANPIVVNAGQRQMARLLHAMGDVHPHALKAELAQELSRITFERWSSGATSPGAITGKTIFSNSGFEAVESALKTALLATGRERVIAFTGAYHGLGYGALNATHRTHFREPFRRQLGEFADFVPFPETAEDLTRSKLQLNQLCRKRRIGAILVEPVQGRGGIRVPPSGFLPLLRQICDAQGALLIADEIYTGFGRTGRWFGSEWSGTIPDLICLGKALTGGFPLSACVGRADLMDAAWPLSEGEAIHTSTFLGHPVGCAMALAQLNEIRRLQLVSRSARLGSDLLKALDQIRLPSNLQARARGLGLMVGLDLRHRNGRPATNTAIRAIQRLLQAGYIFLPEGQRSNVIAFTPPLIITRAQLEDAVRAVQESITWAVAV
jgi:4-aminobutyrate aminotransferase-like enzyme